MSHTQYQQSTLLSNVQNMINRRSSSLFTQINPNFTQITHQPANQSIKQSSIQGVKYTNNDYPAYSKENTVRAIKKSHPDMNTGDEVIKLNHQNQRLRRELEKQKNHYQYQISRLKKNIAMKDQLLDQCQVEIGNLKITYQKFISQNAKNHPQTFDTIKIKQQNHSQANNSKKQEEVPNGNSQIQSGLIPLSIVPKRCESLSHLAAQKSSSSQKLSHGLMKRII